MARINNTLVLVIQVGSPIEYEYEYRFTEYEYDFDAIDPGDQREVKNELHFACVLLKQFHAELFHFPVQVRSLQAKIFGCQSHIPLCPIDVTLNVLPLECVGCI